MRALWTHSWLAFCWHEAAAQKYEYRERKCMLWNDADFITLLVPIQPSQVRQNEQRLFMVPRYPLAKLQCHRAARGCVHPWSKPLLARQVHET